jgi:hypothetical protein
MSNAPSKCLRLQIYYSIAGKVARAKKKPPVLPGGNSIEQQPIGVLFPGQPGRSARQKFKASYCWPSQQPSQQPARQLLQRLALQPFQLLVLQLSPQPVLQRG